MKLNVELTQSELEAVIDYHTNLEQSYADKQEYIDADFHARRAKELRALLASSKAPAVPK